MPSLLITSLTSPAIATLLIGLLLQNVCFVAVTAFALRRGGVTWSAAGLARPSNRQIAVGIGLGLGLVFMIHGFGAFEFWALRHVLPAPTYRALETLNSRIGAEKTFKELPSQSMMILFALLGTIAAPIGEEFFFRGLVYNALKRRLRGVWRETGAQTAAMIGSALLFALLHVSPLNLLPIFIMGLAFAYAYERTGSLWVTVLMHAVNNGAAFVMLALASGS